MKFVISTAALLLLLGTSASAYALQEKGQEEQKQQSKPAQKEAKPAQQQHQQAKPAQQQHQQSKPATHQQTTKPAQQQHTQRAARTQQSQTRTATRTQQTNTNRNQSRTQQTRASNGNNGNNGEHGRITNEHYTASFGSEHRFHVNQGDYDHRRFDYGGYSFGFIDPWPMGWGYGDDVYVVYVDGGYYMYDVVHPGVRLSINIL